MMGGWKTASESKIRYLTKAWESVLYFHRDAAARVTDDVCPDRIADGQPAVLATRSPAASPLQKDAPIGVPSNTAAPAPRLSGMWEPKTFGFMVPEAPLSNAGRDMVDRGAAAMRDGKIMHTAWTSCRPGAISTMTMPREKILLAAIPGELTILFEMPRMIRRVRMNATHPNNLESSYVETPWDTGTATLWWSIPWASTAMRNLMHADSRPVPVLHTVERMTPTADGSSLDIEVTITDPEYYDRPFTIRRSWKRSAAHGTPSNTTAWRIRARRTFENAYYVRDRYRPTCMRVEGEGLALSKVVCRRELP
jgi:hypothetical protein